MGTPVLTMRQQRRTRGGGRYTIAVVGFAGAGKTSLMASSVTRFLVPDESGVSVRPPDEKMLEITRIWRQIEGRDMEYNWPRPNLAGLKRLPLSVQVRTGEDRVFPGLELDYLDYAGESLGNIQEHPADIAAGEVHRAIKSAHAVLGVELERIPGGVLRPFQVEAVPACALTPPDHTLVRLAEARDGLLRRWAGRLSRMPAKLTISAAFPFVMIEISRRDVVASGGDARPDQTRPNPAGWQYRRKTVLVPGFAPGPELASLLEYVTNDHDLSDGRPIGERTVLRELRLGSGTTHTIVFRAVAVTGRTYGTGGDDPLRDGSRRRIHVLEGLLVKTSAEQVRRAGITEADFAAVREQVAPAYRAFWAATGTFTPPPVPRDPARRTAPGHRSDSADRRRGVYPGSGHHRYRNPHATPRIDRGTGGDRRRRRSHRRLGPARRATRAANTRTFRRGDRSERSAADRAQLRHSGDRRPVHRSAEP